MIRKIFKISFNENFVQTFTKKWVSRLMWFAVLSTSFTFGMAAIAVIKGLNYKIIASLVDLSKYCIYMIIGVMFFYMIKAFFGKYAEEKNRIFQARNPKDWSDENDIVTYEEYEDEEYEEED